jgi:hypothetical protein
MRRKSEPSPNNPVVKLLLPTPENRSKKAPIFFSLQFPFSFILFFNSPQKQWIVLFVMNGSASKETECLDHYLDVDTLFAMFASPICFKFLLLPLLLSQQNVLYVKAVLTFPLKEQMGFHLAML